MYDRKSDIASSILSTRSSFPSYGLKFIISAMYPDLRMFLSGSVTSLVSSVSLTQSFFIDDTLLRTTPPESRISLSLSLSLPLNIESKSIPSAVEAAAWTAASESAAATAAVLILSVSIPP